MSRATMLAATLSLLLAACGTSAAVGETSPTTTPTTTTFASSTTTTSTQAVESPPIQVVLASFETDPAEIRAARIVGSMEFEGLSAEAGITSGTITFGTTFNEATGDSSFLMDMSALFDAAEVAEEDDPLGLASGLLGETEFRTIGDRVYVKFPFVTALLGAETPWVSMPEEDGSDFTTESSEVPQDPRDILDAYEDADGTVENLGVESVNGVTATHYRILLDTDTMRLTATERAELEESGLFAAGDIPMDVWFTEDGHMVKLVMEIDGTGLDVPPEDQFVRMTLRYDVFDINGDVRVEPPPADQVTAIEDLDPFGTQD